jgi:hypothetical protein
MPDESRYRTSVVLVSLDDSVHRQPAPEPVAPKQPLTFGLEDGTPVKLELNRTISSADAHVNDTVDFEVLEQVNVHNEIVIPQRCNCVGDCD